MEGDNQGDLPDNWATATLGDLLGAHGVFSDGDWVESKDQDPNGGVRLIQLADVGDGHFVDASNRFLTEQKARELKCTFLRKGDILVARMPDPLGRACLFPLDGEGRFVTVVDVCVVRPGHELIDRKFLTYALNSPAIRVAVDSHKSGSTRKRISRKNLGRVQIPIAPANEQSRIVAKLEELLSELDKGVGSLQTARAQLEVYRQALLKHAFEGKLTADWRETFDDGPIEDVDALLARVLRLRESREQEELDAWEKAVEDWKQRGECGPRPSKPQRFKPLEPVGRDEVAALPALPEAWRYVRLAEIAHIGSGMSVSSRRKVEDPIEVSYLRVANVQRGHLVLDEIKTMTVERSHLPRLQLHRWDVLFNEGGDRDKLGRGWIWDCQVEPCITQNHVFRASPVLSSELHSKWISYWGNSFGQRYFDDEGKQTTNLASINKTVLSRFPVPLPPAKEQEAIVQLLEEKMTVIDHLDVEIGMALARLDALRQSILKRAFDGCLVAQDPEDEPACVLLERIRAKRDAQSINKTKRKAAS